MATKLLVPIEDVIERMHLPDMQGIRKAVEQAALGATRDLESELRTSFDYEAGRLDLFYVPDSDLRGSRFEEKVRLTKGFVTEGDRDLRVRVASRRIGLIILDPATAASNDFIDLRDPNPTTSGARPIDVEHKDQFVHLVDGSLKRGIVTIQDYRLFRLYVECRYDAGIHTDRNTENLYQQDDATVSMAGGPDLTFAATGSTITRASGVWETDGFRAGELITVTGTSSNDHVFKIESLDSNTQITVSGDDAVEDEVVSGAAVVTNLRGVPDDLKELALAWTMLDLVSNPRVGIDTEERGAALRPDVLKAKIMALTDDLSRFEPEAHRPVC